MSANSAGPPIVTVSRRGADRIRGGHVWVYRSDVIEAAGVPPGALVTVQEVGGRTRPSHARTLGSAFYSSASEIAIRMISPKPVDNVDQLVRERIRSAIAYRERLVEETNAYRVVFSEGDFLPGLIADRYNDVLSFQVLTQAMDLPDMRRTFVTALSSAFHPALIVERVDARVRKLEQLPEKENEVVFEEARSSGERPVPPPSEVGAPGVSARERPAVESTRFGMNGVQFLLDPLAGQKTGAFLDQRENYAAAARYARGEALDVFCYQGGFALHLARVADKVTGIDSSRPALEAAEQNAKLNGREIEWIEANAFDLLRDYSDAGRRYDTIVVDPPAFAKSRRDAPAALRAHKELNLRALKMLRPGGILVTCSCSYHVSAADLLEATTSASLDSHRNIRLLENRGQSKDHPSVLGIPETAYLKCLVLLTS
jgi:23S rRNA (cytosine1962-C5)-methyltransferase